MAPALKGQLITKHMNNRHENRCCVCGDQIKGGTRTCFGFTSQPSFKTELPRAERKQGTEPVGLLVEQSELCFSILASAWIDAAWNGSAWHDTNGDRRNDVQTGFKCEGLNLQKVGTVKCCCCCIISACGSLLKVKRQLAKVMWRYSSKHCAKARGWTPSAPPHTVMVQPTLNQDASNWGCCVIQDLYFLK